MGLTPSKAGFELINEAAAAKRYKSATLSELLHTFYIVSVLPYP
jgi:hypothetical protein